MKGLLLSSSADRPRVVRLGDERLLVGPWRGDRRVAYLAPATPHPPSPAVVGKALGALARSGYGEAITGALAPAEQAGFLAAGFTVHEHLHLLAADLGARPPAPPVPTRRGGRGDRGAALAVDGAAFPPFWRLDARGFADALRATPTARFRVGADGPVRGYAITGRAGDRGYLQRLAVHPADQGRGLGTALVLDALGWLHRRGGHRALVNTQEANEAAVRLYERLGFRRQPEGLAVLRCPLGTAR